MNSIVGLIAPWLIAGGVLLLHLVLPARRIEGYVMGEDGRPLVYRINGLFVFIVTLASWGVACFLGWLPFDWLYTHRWEGLAGAVVMGFVYTFYIVLPAPKVRSSLLKDLFFGRVENPRALSGRVDVKMFLYLFGATLLALNILSFAAHHWLLYRGDSSLGVLLYVVLFGWFLCDYLIFERVHLYTYDIFAERVGFKLGWGCLAFYPYFYCVGLWSTAELPSPGRSHVFLALSAVVFFIGWGLARGANMQKYFFKRDPEHIFLGIFRPEAISDGQRRLLCSGFWGISRHVNYLGEILMATGLAMSLGWPKLGPWLYPLYYVLLLVPRERDDERRCAAKYGALWTAYCQRVRRRIVPWLY